MSLKKRLYLLLVLVLTGFLAFSAVAFFTLDKLKIGGAEYDRIIRGKDLVADILPPPEYVIESYLVALQIENALEEKDSPAVIHPLIARLAALEKDYNERHAYWNKEPLDGEMKGVFLGDSFKHAQDFYVLARSTFIPAVKANDLTRADIALGQMKKAYELHRVAIDKVVVRANQENERLEKEAAASNTQGIMVLLLVMFATLLGAGGYMLLFSRNLLNRLGGEPDYAKEVARQIASGDLSLEIDIHRGDDSSLLAYMKDMQTQLRDLVGQIQGNVGLLGQNMRCLSDASRDVSGGSHLQTEAAASMTMAVGKLTDNLRQVAAMTSGADPGALKVGELAAEGAQTMRQTVDEMSKITDAVNHSSQVIEGLGEESRRISSIAAVIRDIAEQTNLLALNAAIEAARAGEQGRGFAVVADEVRKLAERTSGSTREIAGMIENIQQGTANAIASMHDGSALIDQGVGMVNLAESSIEQITLSANQVIEKMRVISSSLQEQDSASHDVAENVDKVARLSGKTDTSVAGISDATHSLERLAESLHESVNRFRT
jgi:methyl-accepting chemotaxis protein